MDEEKEYLELYSENCLRCAHLIEGAKNEYDDCHYTAGNTNCPAAEIQVIVSGKVRRAAQLIRTARKENDPRKEAEILQSIAGESKAFLHLLYDMIG